MKYLAKVIKEIIQLINETMEGKVMKKYLFIAATGFFLSSCTVFQPGGGYDDVYFTAAPAKSETYTQTETEIGRASCRERV